MSQRFAVILAAGKGTRMKSNLYKVLHPVCGKPMIKHILDQIAPIGFDRIVTIVSEGAEAVKAELGDRVAYAIQAEQLGTAHATLQAAAHLEGLQGTTVVLYGDTPLITGETVSRLLQHHEESSAVCTVLTAIASNPKGYGRIIRNSNGQVIDIVEEKDATAEQKAITEINTGIYCFDNVKLFDVLKRVDNDNAQKEYYLPSAFTLLREMGEKVSAYQADVFEDTLGVNDRVALAQAEAIMQKRINEALMMSGVTIKDPQTTYIDADVKIGRDTVVLPGSILSGRTEIGEGCTIGPNSEISNTKVGNYTTIRHSVVSDSEIGSEVQIGPFSHIRPQTAIGDRAKVGNFVEVKKSTIGEGSKASHLSYVGDAEIGKDVNLGCGMITVNYDGKYKYLTKVEDGAFIGCNVNLIAPVTVGKEAIVAAGSTITEDVEADSLAIARARQTNKAHYANRYNHKKK
ncbi:bifunctional UDP-N-acetylglucosamine diphosphorylase/glucosamine-1-phosphate N-acetyltransferase GlmU [Tuberibacillus calidus]|uniref:bifunctional UDP-N-acetylglucosamine diphosphorylase/glucosamine-1-phosphate N-acetyltransferase GlmU n=1 Tax=Tuberibacillus calidus TaxID=340097 RepID=UPI000406AF8E|nr:bifunctional UDP-N-acetylglucosamine diphosphorylase/glucosamine-1-phosphate N-acetyltransferase GlmU [Tuberibacillus calidus]